MPMELKCYDTAGRQSSSNISKPRHNDDTKVPSIANSLRKKELPNTKLQNRVNAFILPRTGINTIAGYVIPCT